MVNPLADVGKYLPHSVSSSNYGQFDDPKEIEMYDRQLRELDNAKQQGGLAQFREPTKRNDRRP